jgi:hypothetical protein
MVTLTVSFGYAVFVTPLLAGFALRPSRRAGRLGLGIAIPIVGAVFLLSAAGLALKTGILAEGHPAVIVAREPTLREGPDPRARLRDAVHEGERARILDRGGPWAHVKVGGGREGWMAADEVGAI